MSSIAGRLGRQQPPCAVTQLEQRPQLARLGAGHRQGLLRALRDGRERAVRRGRRCARPTHPAGRAPPPAGAVDERHVALLGDGTAGATCRARPRSARSRGRPRRACRRRARRRSAELVERHVGRTSSVSLAYMPRPAARCPRIISGRSASQALIRICSPSTSTAPRALPARVGGGCARAAAAKDQQVHDRVGAGRPAVRSARQPDRADQVGELAHLPPRGRVAPHRA